MTGPRVLVVEDEPAIADALRYALTTEGFVVTLVGTLAEARAALVEAPALIVLDVGLPDGNGFDFCRELRRSSTVPVLFLTARSGEIDRVVGLELGADDYVAKPFSPREVGARVRAILRRCAPAVPAGSALRLDPERRRAVYCGTTLELTTQQFRILAALAERPGAVLSRSRLLDLAWDEPGSVVDRIIDTHIKALRAVLRAVRAEPDPIRTVRGEGYALAEELCA